MKTVAYVRVSTDDQSQNGVSLAAQEQKIRQYCELYGLNLVEVITDAGLSAKDLIHRPGAQRILNMVRRQEIGAVVIAKLDRLTRSVRDLAEIVEIFNRAGVSLISVNEHIDTGSAAGRMILNMLGVISQWERETIGERTATALRFKKNQGLKYNRNPPYGYDHQEGKLVINGQEQCIINRIETMHSQKLTLRGIANTLNTEGTKTSCGGMWSPVMVKRVLKAENDRICSEKTCSVA